MYSSNPIYLHCAPAERARRNEVLCRVVGDVDVHFSQFTRPLHYLLERHRMRLSHTFRQFAGRYDAIETLLDPERRDLGSLHVCWPVGDDSTPSPIARKEPAGIRAEPYLRGVAAVNLNQFVKK